MYNKTKYKIRYKYLEKTFVRLYTTYKIYYLDTYMYIYILGELGYDNLMSPANLFLCVWTVL